MGLGGYLAARSDAEHYASERERDGNYGDGERIVVGAGHGRPLVTLGTDLEARGFDALGIVGE